MTNALEWENMTEDELLDLLKMTKKIQGINGKPKKE